MECFAGKGVANQSVGRSDGACGKETDHALGDGFAALHVMREWEPVVDGSAGVRRFQFAVVRVEVVRSRRFGVLPRPLSMVRYMKSFIRRVVKKRI
jgi:hypothetical protein